VKKAKKRSRPLGLLAYQREYARCMGNHEWLDIHMHIDGKGGFVSLWLNGVRYV